MKKLFFITLLLLHIGVVVSQREVKHNITQAQARLVETEFRAVTFPIIGELDDSFIVKIIDSVEFDISMFTDAKTEIVPRLNDYKQYTIAHTCAQNNYDVILNPLFQISTNEAGNLLKVIVTGFAAKYKKFRNATNEDSWILPFMHDFDTDNRIRNTLKNN